MIPKNIGAPPQTLLRDSSTPFIRAFTFLLACLLVFAPSAAHTADLPEKVGEWRGMPAQVTEFTLTKDNENVGRWENRVYTRAAPIASVEANLMKGSGPGTLFVHEEGNEFTPPPYEVLNIAGKRAILEYEEATGQALAVALGKDSTLTLESKSLSREELLSFARNLIAILEVHS